MALNYKGEQFVIALNTLGKSATTGDTYRCFNDGHLELGQLNVKRGDFISWNGSGWQLEPTVKLLNTLDLVDIQALVKQALAYTDATVSPTVVDNKIAVTLDDRSILTVNLPNNGNNKQIDITCDNVVDAYIILKPEPLRYITANKIAFIRNNVAMHVYGTPVINARYDTWEEPEVGKLLQTTSLTPMDEPEVPSSFSDVDVLGSNADSIVKSVETQTFSGNTAVQQPVVYHVVGSLVYLCAIG